MSLKTALLHELHALIKSNIKRHDKLCISLRNAITDGRRQKIARDMARQASYIYKLSKLYNRFATDKLPRAEPKIQTEELNHTTISPPKKLVSDVFVEDVMLMA